MEKPSVTRPFLCCWHHLANMIECSGNLFFGLL